MTLGKPNCQEDADLSVTPFARKAESRPSPQHIAIKRFALCLVRIDPRCVSQVTFAPRAPFATLRAEWPGLRKTPGLTAWLVGEEAHRVAGGQSIGGSLLAL